MTRKRPEPPAIPEPPERWEIEIEPTDVMPFGRWRIRLVRGWLTYAGGDGWGWTAYTLAGARRKGRRELARELRKEANMERRRLLV